MPMLLVLIGLIGAVGIPPHASLLHIATQGIVSVSIMALGAYMLHKRG